MVTAHVAVEYFSVYHPKVVDSNSPVVMALVWGVGAAWWFGLIVGVILAIVNARRASPLPVRHIRLVVIKACVALWLTMMSILVVTYALIGLLFARDRPTFEHDRRLMAVAATHGTEYELGAIALIVVARHVWKSRDPAESHDSA